MGKVKRTIAVMPKISSIYFTPSKTPVAVPFFADKPVIKIICGAKFSLVVTGILSKLLA